MSDRVIIVQPLSAKAFAPFGDVMEAVGAPTKMINQGLCGRFHDLAKPDILPFGDEDPGHIGISLFDAEPRALPYRLDMMERHPLGSQAFIPMSLSPFLIIVAHDKDDTPDTPIAFLSAPGQAINYHRDVWHGVLTPLHAPGLFAVVDRIGTAQNLQEFWFDEPYIIKSDKDT